jgi:hypothetical protein
MSLHKEIEFENDICAHLAKHDWLHAEADYAGYDRARALFPAAVTGKIDVRALSPSPSPMLGEGSNQETL